jgi:hypothetical protein
MGRFLTIVIVVGAASGCANDPEYVKCGATDMMDTCLLDTANAGSGAMNVKGSLHVPVRPLTKDLMKVQADLQKTLPADVMAPMYRIDEFDISVEYTVKNLENKPGQIKIGLDGANEMFAWDPSLIMPADKEAPPPPDLAGDVPIDIAENGELDGVFREDQLLEAAIDLDQITRGNVNMYAATLVVNKNDPSFQPMSAQLPPPPGSIDPPPQMPLGSAVPRAAFRQFVRVDIVFQASTHMTLEFSLRVRPHTNDVIHDKGMDAPAAELTILDPAPYVPGYTP